AELGVAATARPEIETPLEERRVRRWIPAKRCGNRLHGNALRLEPATPIGLDDSSRIEDPGAEGGGVFLETRGRSNGLHVDRRLQIGRSEVGVNDPGELLVEAEAEEQVVGGDRMGERA